MKRRSSGILLHISSLAAPFGIGDMGPAAYEFADFLAASKQTLWQILPLSPAGPDGSPYSGMSAFAGNPLLISPELLAREKLIKIPGSAPDAGKVDFRAVAEFKTRLLREAFERCGNRDEFIEKFRNENPLWIDDYALYRALSVRFGGKSWNRWPGRVRSRDPEKLACWKERLKQEIEYEVFVQALFYSQWRRLKAYCNERGVQIIGDIPYYLSYDSADVWAHADIFKLDDKKRPVVVSGVPPDYFSKTGQLWGNPVYNWCFLRQNGYKWWIDRVLHCFSIYDLLRIDHFRGIASSWEVPAAHKTALKGQWVQGPGGDFMRELYKHKPCPALIAEDLGYITPDVREMLHDFDIPGMKVLLFAFGGKLAENPYLPFRHPPNSVVYTGTHDNNTVLGWYRKEAAGQIRRNLFRYLGRRVAGADLPGEFVRMAMASPSNMAVVPIQDVFGLGEEARMNNPAGGDGSWTWRMTPQQLAPAVGRRLRQITETYGRA